ncbi:MAG: glycosyltransferase family 87 protein [Candidatus Limnocylindrales bacterium]
MKSIAPEQPSPARDWRQLPGIRVFTVLGLERTLRITAVIALIVGMGWVIVNARPWEGSPASWILDTGNYYAAGERLNAGHSLYAYSPGDRHVLALLFGLQSPYLYPPLIGVLWRPVAALLPYEPVITLWWATSLVSFLAFLFWLLKRGGTVTAIGVLILLVPLVETAWSGNVSTFITMGIVLAWFALQRGHDRTAGAVVGLTSVLKLTPVFLAWWLLVERRWQAIQAAIVIGLISLAVGILGAGLTAHLDYLRISDAVARGGGIQGSIVGILTGLGASPDLMPLVAPIVSVIGIVAIFALRRRKRAAWVVAIGTGVFASPIFNLTNVTLLLAAFVALDQRHFAPTDRLPEPESSRMGNARRTTAPRGSE